MAATIPPVPTDPPSPPIQRGDRATFANRVDAAITYLTDAPDEIYEIAQNAYGNAVESYGSAVASIAAKDLAVPAAASAVAANLAAQATRPVTSLTPPLNPVENAEWIHANTLRKYTYTATTGGYAWIETEVNSVYQSPTTAADQSFVAAGTGAVARSTLDKLRETISVKDFGAKGDGVTNDAPAIQKAIDYINSLPDGGEMYMPAGKYKIASPIAAVMSKYLRLYGDGKSTKIFGATGFGFLINAGTSANAAHGSILEKFMLTGPSAGITSGISLTNANVFQVRDLWIQSQDIGITMADSYGVEYSGLVFDVTRSEAIRATTSAHNTVITTTHFFSCGITNTKAAVNFQVMSNNLVIDTNDFEYCYRSLAMNGCTSVSMVGNYSEYCTVGDLDFTGTCAGVAIERNWFAFAAAPLVLSNLFGATFKHNTIYDHTVNIGTNVNQLECALNPTMGTGVVNINFLKHESKGVGGIPSLSPYGIDPNIQMRISSRGAADVAIYTNTENNLGILVGNVANSVNYLRVAPSAAGFPVALTAQGASTDISFRVFPKGTGDFLLATGHMRVQQVGAGLRVAEGANAKQGVATLVGGTFTVANTSVTANSRIFLTAQTTGGTPGFLRVSARTDGTSFTITSSSNTDTSVVAWQIFEPA